MVHPPAKRTGEVRGFAFALAAFCLCLALYAFLRSPLFALHEVVVRGNRIVSADELVAAAGISLGTNLFQIDLPSVAARLRQDPRLVEVRVRRRWPDRLEILVQEGSPVALLMVGNTSFLIDEAGRLLGPPTGVLPPLPVITVAGTPARLEPGKVVAEERLRAAAAVAGLLESRLPGRISEVRAEANGELTLYTRDLVRVRFGSRVQADIKVQVLTALLDRLAQEGRAVTEVDVRFPSSPTAREDH